MRDHLGVHFRDAPASSIWLMLLAAAFAVFNLEAISERVHRAMPGPGQAESEGSVRWAVTFAD
ncbi:hypothetical protein [Dokdonella sp.]|uniref:hypothetical protein n=1 Tax=Dokdonella sp. TaxID=2291710 RepID=UPI0035276BB6